MSYLRMNETRAEIIIVDPWVKMTWAGFNIPYYQELGYEYTGYTDTFWCHVNHLQPSSSKKILVRCPVCKKNRMAKYSNITQVEHSLCNGCSKIIDLRGIKFDRLLVLKLDLNSHRDRPAWICRCDCGNITSVAASHLGHIVSCGCYRQEVLERSGESHPLWDPDITEEERIIGRSYPEYREWVRAVLKRDERICQVCGSAGKVEAHHLYSYAHYPEHRLDIRYGLTLCNCCHAEFHSWMGSTRTRCIPSDIDRWLYATS